MCGLNKVSVDFQPTIATNVPNTGNANQPEPGADAVPEEAPQLRKAKSVVQQLDVLLVNAAEQWKNYRKQNWMTPIESELTIKKHNNTTVTVDHDIKCVNDFLRQNCPSYFKRDYVHLMFKKPEP